MSNEVSIQSCMDIVKEFCTARDWDQFHNAKDLAIGIATEAGELLDLFRFKSLSDISGIFGNPEKLTKVEEEIADVFFFVLRFAQMNEIDLGNALESKLMKNNEKYPAEQVKGKNLKYNEY